MNNHMLRSARQVFFAGLMALAAFESASAHTVTVLSCSETMGSMTSESGWTDETYTYGAIGNWTCQTTGGFGRLLATKGGYSASIDGTADLYPTYNWQILWTPSNPLDIPNGCSVVFSQRYQYDVTSALGGSTENTGLITSNFKSDLLPDVSTEVNGVPPLYDAISETSWVNGNNIVVTGTNWVEQPNSTWILNIPVEDYIQAIAQGNESSSVEAAKNLVGTVSFTIQITLNSVADVDFTLWE